MQVLEDRRVGQSDCFMKHNFWIEFCLGYWSLDLSQWVESCSNEFYAHSY